MSLSIKSHVVLVNPQDEVLGVSEKIRAHELGLLHRAFSVFVYRFSPSVKASSSEAIPATVSGAVSSAVSENLGQARLDELHFLLQKRHSQKYHSGGLWTNTCCSHPEWEEDLLKAARRRLKEEMSLDLPLRRAGSFIYQAKFLNGLIEHELDHVLLAEFEGKEQDIIPNPLEVEEFRWVSLSTLLNELSRNPERYTPWFQPALELALEEICQTS